LFQASQPVAVTSDPGAVIRCTTDGSNPTAATPPTASPVIIDKNTNLKCIATKPQAMPSALTAGAYTIQPPPPPPPPTPPPPPPPPLKVGKHELREKIYFDTGKATIKPVSYPLLDDAAKTLNAHPEVKKIAIEGHTDSKGKPAANQKLSQARAESVRQYLIGKGVAADRLVAQGFGQDRPIADNKTVVGRETNRRVDIRILE
jgi:outer membrane protein OmpA-like peptidoglycan-associated protein